MTIELLDLGISSRRLSVASGSEQFRFVAGGIYDRHNCRNSSISFDASGRRIAPTAGGPEDHVSTLYRWATAGCRGVVLESIQVGGTRCTSREALQRFFERLSQPARPGPLAEANRQPGPFVGRRTVAQRQRHAGGGRSQAGRVGGLKHEEPICGNANGRDGETLRLESLPDVLWNMARMVIELRADDQTIRRWVREGELPGPTLRCGGRTCWSPTTFSSFDVSGSVRSGPK